MERKASSSNRSRIVRSGSRNKENVNNKEKRTSSLQRRLSVLSIRSSSSSIQKPVRGRSRNRLIMHDVIATNNVVIGHRNDNDDIDVQIQENILSSEQQQRQQSSTSRLPLAQMSNNDDESASNDDENSAEHQNSSTASEDDIWSFFLHVGPNAYQCRLCLKACDFFS